MNIYIYIYIIYIHTYMNIFFQHANLGTLEDHVFVCKSSLAKYFITSQAVKSRSQKSEEETALSISTL